MNKAFKPNMLSASRMNAVTQGNKSFIDNLKQSLYEVSNIGFIRESLAIIRLKPGLSIDNASAYIVNVKGNNLVMEIEPVYQANWTIDIATAKVGWDATDKIGYRVDGTTLGISDEGLIWAFANDDNTELIGFAATEFPDTTFSVVATGTMGSLGTYTCVDAYRFKVGATVVIANTSGYESNYGVINTITSNTSMTVKMYPSISYMHNTNITNATGGSIFQIDNYFPWNGRTDTDSEADRTYLPNYQLIGTWDPTNETYIADPGVITPVGSIIAWHADFVTAQQLPWGWAECDGSICLDRQSIYYGETLPDLNGEGRFLRGAVASGTMQAATSIWDYESAATDILVAESGTLVYNDDGFETQNLTFSNALRNSGPATVSRDDYAKVRPVNMSVVWIIKTR